MALLSVAVFYSVGASVAELFNFGFVNEVIIASLAAIAAIFIAFRKLNKWFS
jgi:hypothetical protein